jgi:hypothetical protein
LCQKIVDFFGKQSAAERGGRLLGEMGNEPIANGGGHLVKILSPSELVIGLRKKNQLLWTSQGVTQSPALMEGDTFILLALNNQCGHGDSFSRPIGDLSEGVFVKVMS